MTTDSAIEGLGRIRAKALMLLAVTFLAGAAAGGAGARLISPSGPIMPPFMGGPPRSAADDPRFIGLGLTPAQTRHIDSVLAKGRPRVEAIMEESMPKLRSVLDSIRTEIRTVLTPEQRDRFEKTVARFRGMPPRFGPGDGPFGRVDSVR
jgi:Spy/CpxP family protein refolding chaperone